MRRFRAHPGQAAYGEPGGDVLRVTGQNQASQVRQLHVNQPDQGTALAACVESYRSYRLKGAALAALSEVQLVAGDPAVLTAAKEAFKLTRPVHYARDGVDLDSKTDKAYLFRYLACCRVKTTPETPAHATCRLQFGLQSPRVQRRLHLSTLPR